MTLGKPLVEPTSDMDTAKTAPPRPQEISVRRNRRDRHTRRIVFGLTGVLGVAWAVVIASRYSGLLAG
ncbi:hypothetical protein [Methylobacterium sp. J-090]|uniref:hypothetical protein n=1 Tax=Methylobacterium sp. J-090 TaxID=2836666 RepID=UPI001FB89F69|nr:hypothetical protein [Methylobacterium sp. J-090]MCJ2083189.1 hypothetical protein [Methylobacterium sp. J-090]